MKRSANAHILDGFEVEEGHVGHNQLLVVDRPRGGSAVGREREREEKRKAQEG